MQHALQLIGLYVGLNLLLNLALALIVWKARLDSGLMTGEGERGSLLYRAGRAHTLNGEYTPIILVGMVTLYVLAAPNAILHLIGITLTLGRLLHAVGLLQTAEKSKPRLIGALLTWFSLALAGLACLYFAFA